MADDDGLSIKIETTGSKSWSYRYTDPSTGKRQRKTIGNYPEMNLKAARAERDSKRLNLNKTGCWENNKSVDDVLLFSNVAKEWLDFKYKNSLGDNPRCGVLELSRKSLDNDILPVIGDKKFKDIKRIDLVNIIRKIEDRGVKEPVKKACSYLSQLYDYAVAVGYTDYNIALNLNKVLIKTKIKKNYSHLKSSEVGKFIINLEKAKAHPIVKKALLLKLYTGVRGAEILTSKPEHFDLNAKLWKIPAIHVKQLRRKALMGFDVPDYIVPLSDQAVEIVQSALEWSHGERYVFASPKKVGQHIHFNSLNSLIRRMGYTKEDLSSHGLRSTMSTVLNESGLFKSEWIESQLSHSDKDAVRGTYNHADYIEHRKNMIQWWADYINYQKMEITA